MLIADLVVAEAAAHADLVTADVIAWSGPNDDAAAVAHTELDGAADGALGAGGADPAVGPCNPLVWGFHESGSRANINAGPAEVAVGLVDAASGSESNAGGESASGQGDSCGVTKFVAGAHTA